MYPNVITIANLMFNMLFGFSNIKLVIVKPESKSPIPCPYRPQILTISSNQV